MLHPKDLRVGSRRKNPQGYIQIYCPDHPICHKKRRDVLEHRLIMEREIGRFLKYGEEVHHINRVRDDNQLENLQLFATVGEHRRHHKPPKRCPTCGEFHNPGGQAMAHCSKCGKVVRLKGRNHFPAVCWACRFPKRKCTVCGTTTNVWNTTLNGETRLLCDNHGKHWRRRLKNPNGQTYWPKGVDHGNAKYTERQVLHVKRLLLTGMMHKDIEKKTGVPKGTITRINCGKNWAHLKP